MLGRSSYARAAEKELASYLRSAALDVCRARAGRRRGRRAGFGQEYAADRSWNRRCTPAKITVEGGGTFPRSEGLAERLALLIDEDQSITVSIRVELNQAVPRFDKIGARSWRAHVAEVRVPVCLWSLIATLSGIEA